MCVNSETCTHSDGHPAGLSRRRFVTLATLAGGAALLQVVPSPAFASGKAEALVLSCMDYRLADNTHDILDGMGLTDKYDHIVLAGASAGVMNENFADWHATFWSHLDVAIQLHGIHKVIVMDHRDCGAYKIAFGAEHAADLAAETALHTEVLQQFKAAVKEKKPELEFEGYLLAIDGTVEKLV
jgi:carbonic anhydrase